MTNKYGQLVDPDAGCVKAWAGRNWAGYSDSYWNRFGTLNNDWMAEADTRTDSEWNAYAIRIMYAGITSTCSFYSSFGDSDAYSPSFVNNLGSNGANITRRPGTCRLSGTRGA
jgi:hypothetical protein